MFIYCSVVFLFHFLCRYYQNINISPRLNLSIYVIQSVELVTRYYFVFFLVCEVCLGNSSSYHYFLILLAVSVRVIFKDLKLLSFSLPGFLPYLVSVKVSTTIGLPLVCSDVHCYLVTK